MTDPRLALTRMLRTNLEPDKLEPALELVATVIAEAFAYGRTVGPAPPPPTHEEG